VEIYLEQGAKRTFACAVAWPGWARSGKGDEAAIEELSTYGPRYAAVAARAGVRLPSRPDFSVIEWLPGTATTDFGAPDVAATADSIPLRAADLTRQVRLLQAAWETFDEVAAAAPAELRKGPRGGGRDRDEVVRHVHEVERAYARKLGVRHPPLRADGALEALRADEVSALLSGATVGGWSAAYAIRRIAWHVLDHAWEIQDKST
jgi:hypothetical protein